MMRAFNPGSAARPWALELNRFAVLLVLLIVPLAAPAADLGKARSLLMHGRYEEAAEIYKPEATASPQAALGWAACLESQGKTAAAVEALKPLADKQADLQAHLARLAFERGDYVEARRRAAATLKLASEHPLALYLLGELSPHLGPLGRGRGPLPPLDQLL